MATSGYFQTNEYHGSKHKGLQFNWSRTGYDIDGNYSDISWEWVGFGSDSGYHELRNSYLNVDGERVYTQKSGSTKQLYSGTVVASGTKRIYHNNDGTKSFSADGGGGVYTASVNCTGEGTWTLDQIPRYFTSAPTLTLQSKTETTATFKWTTPETCDQAQYKIGSGSWVDIYSGSGATSGTYTITGLTPNTPYTIYGDYKRKDSQQWSTWGGYTVSTPVTTHKYPYISSAPNFSIGNQNTIGIHNPLGRSCTVYLVGADNTQRGGDTTTGTSISGYNNTSWVDWLYSTIPNNNDGTYKVRLVCSELSRDTTVNGGTYSTKVSECKPTFTNFTYRDFNSSVSTVTGSDQVLVKGLSVLEVTIPSADKMVTQKYATPSSYNISCDGLNQNVAYSSQDVTAQVDSGIITNSGSKTIKTVAYDSRGNNATVNKNVTVYDYAKPVININASRLNNFENETTLKISGTYTKLTINNTDKNAVTGVQYRYREAGGSWGSYTAVQTTASNGQYTCNDVILSLDNTKAYEFEVKVTDRLQNNTVNASVDIGQSIFFISTNNRTCYINGEEVISNNYTKNINTSGSIMFTNNNSSIYWKENGCGDKFNIIPAFTGADDNNKLKIQGAVGGAGTDPSLYDLMTISAKNGNVDIKGSINATGIDTTLKTLLVNIFYPVGSYYETSDTSFNPNTAWGGTWVEDTPGRFTLATGVVQANTDNFFGALSGRSWNAGVGSKGGQDYSSNPLSDNGYAKMTLHGSGKVCYHELSVSSYNANFYVQGSSGSGQTGHNDTYGAGLGGNTDLGNNMPPYICVKRWHRTA